MGELNDIEIELVSFRTFFHEFLRVLYYVKGILLGLFGVIALFGLLLSFWERIPLRSGVYLAFITAFTIGYGDITPHTPWGKLVCAIVLPILGMVLTGVMVAAAVQAIGRLYKMAPQKQRRS
ncbi:potassium channel family protein [Thermococcus aciditolerans]|uniref:Two pore domain potassium channel family protein n=1 Tax=Thermococcus aciditolerans TaxID=2598455 RepID=A0A5C0SND8_9EURY|nr:potassium channel family protein [Thermococcus aciditolerans]QEK14688.1 two pore domain potassium channel family protein [Thermococcus aciditolerans]